MKTRQEMIYDFMLALAANSDMTEGETVKDIYNFAASLADAYILNQG
jgi:hypothetical protein